MILENHKKWRFTIYSNPFSKTTKRQASKIGIPQGLLVVLGIYISS
jgi:hypothetical protein